MRRFEVCVIGAGSAGVAAAEAARGAGRETVLVTEAGALGGTCILRGCMPAKTLLSSTERLGAVERAETVAVVDASRPHVDLARLIARKRELVDYFAEDRIEEIRSFPLARGLARFVASHAIDVAGERIEADAFVIATGSRIDAAAAMPCLSRGDYFTSDDALEMTAAPERLVVIGGGPVGCEFAQYFARLGSAVTLLQDGPELLRKEDTDVGAAVRRALEADGVRVVLDAAVTGCGRTGEVREVRYRTPAGDDAVEADAAMLATGRVPNLVGLDLAAAGIDAPEGRLAVDAFLRTSNPRVFAAGDVLGRRCLVQAATHGGRVAGRNAAGRGAPVAADLERFESHAVYVQPQVAVAGISEREAAAAGLAVDVRRHPFRELGKAIVSDEPEGFVKMLADDGGRIRGIAIVGDGAVELGGEAIVLVDRGMTLREVAEMPHLHPTMSEIFARVAEDFLPERPTSEARR